MSVLVDTKRGALTHLDPSLPAKVACTTRLTDIGHTGSWWNSRIIKSCVQTVRRFWCRIAVGVVSMLITTDPFIQPLLGQKCEAQRLVYTSHCTCRAEGYRIIIYAARMDFHFRLQQFVAG